MRIMTRDELISLASSLVNAMILEGPENEQELHMLQVLLDPEEQDDLEQTVEDAEKYINEAFDDLEELLEKYD